MSDMSDTMTLFVYPFIFITVVGGFLAASIWVNKVLIRAGNKVSDQQ